MTEYFGAIIPKIELSSLRYFFSRELIPATGKISTSNYSKKNFSLPLRCSSVTFCYLLLGMNFPPKLFAKVIFSPNGEQTACNDSKNLARASVKPLSNTWSPGCG